MRLRIRDNIGRGGGAGARARRGAFTLTEIMVVILIILIVATLALPALNVITGAKSVESATNVVTAMLARARSEAMSRQQPVGLAVYFDQEKGRAALAIVGYAQPWQDGVSYQRGDYVYRDETVNSGASVYTARSYWLCVASHVSNSRAEGMGQADSPPTSKAPVSTGWAAIPSSPTDLNFNPTYSAGSQVPDTYVSILPETDPTYLPAGIAAQTLCAARVASGTGLGQTDRYLRSGVIFFDQYGSVAPQQQWGVMFDPVDAPYPMGSQTPTGSVGATKFKSSRLGLAIRFNTDGSSAAQLVNVGTYPRFNMDPPAPTGTNSSSILRGELGVVLYDRQAYDAQFTSAARAVDAFVTNQPYSSGFGTEGAGELWLDQNGTTLLLNRYTGTVLSTE